MSIDSIAIAALAAEFRATVVGGRVQKVVQADEFTVGLEIYAGRLRRWVLLSANPRQPRIHLSADRLGRADLTTPLLLLMRKYLRGAKLVSVEQPGLERALHLVFATFAGQDGEGESPTIAVDDAPRLSLIIEAIGRYSNVMLVDAGGIVLDSIRRVPADVNRYRVVLPKHPYVPPPPQAKADLAAVSVDDLSSRLDEAPPDAQVQQLMVAWYAGLSPQFAREVVFRVTGSRGSTAGDKPDAAALVGTLREVLSAATAGESPATVARRDGAVVAFAPYELTQHAEFERVDGISTAIEMFYSQLERFRPVDQAREAALPSLTAKRATAQRKYDSLVLALASGARAEQARLSGEAILAHIHEIGRGQTLLRADGLDVDLNPALSASANAQAYFKRYRKSKAALAGVPALLEETRLYLRYLDESAAHLEMAETADQVRAVVRELAVRGKPSAAGVAAVKARSKGRGSKRGQAAPSASSLARYVTADGSEILVGRSGRLNDFLTFDLARPDDIWLHARGVPGAHVILRVSESGDPPQPTLAAAAAVAAWYSSSRGATSVAVDWTRRRFVKRIREAMPGLVTYSSERLIHAAPAIPDDAIRQP